MDLVLELALGIGLSAACGFRVFVPLLALGAASRFDSVVLAPGFAWLGEGPALAILAAATVAEIAAYYVPWLDHALDSIAGPAAVLAGVLASASVLGDAPPWLRWSLAGIAGGGAAASVQALTSGTRGLSTWLTLGLANPLVATAEIAGAVLLSLLALALPLLAALLVVFGLGFGLSRIARARPGPRA